MDRPDIIELNETYRPRFQAWLDAHHVRPTCPACESPDYLLTGRVLVYTFPAYPENWALRYRLCRQCGHVMAFDLGELLEPPNDAPPPATAPQAP